jgi:SAM-dependent methyltransferase
VARRRADRNGENAAYGLASYWDAVIDGGAGQSGLWRAHSDALNSALVARWLPAGDRKVARRILKTDLFDEAAGTGLYPLLRTRADTVVAADLSAATVRAAQSRYPELETVRADVRSLPFADGDFDVVVSNSTLDHFESLADLVAGLRELKRVLATGGELLVTVDNLANPVVALRNALPFPLLQRLGLVPYYVGATVGPRRLRRILTAVGFEIADESVIMHSPRVVAVKVENLIGRGAGFRTRRAFLGVLLRFESLSRWPTRHMTGYFIAVRAVKPA